MTPASPGRPPAADPRLAFRADINGLRAIAVLAVVAFHFGLAPARGGFVGVDIFFVISGYLMTGIILGRIERGTFSILGFYLDRARRIIPALAVLIAVLLGLGALFLLQNDYFQLARQAGASALFLSNIAYWRDVGYFAPAVEQQWLLHTWSLSLEWQFYLLYPLLLPVLVRRAPSLWRHVLAGAALLSFAAMLALSRADPAAGFYLLPPRAWELLAGGLAYGAPALSGRAARAAQALGLGLIAAAIGLVGSSSWPNGWALVPVAGTVLVILAGRTDSRLTGNKAAAWIGLTSYSIYLWHWPIVTWLKGSGRVEWPWTAAGIAAALLLGYLSWRFIERGGRSRAATPRIHTGRVSASWRTLAGYALAPAALALASFFIWHNRGLPQRFPPKVEAVRLEALRHEAVVPAGCFTHGDFPLEPCRLGPPGAPPLVQLIGDSHADAELLGLREALPAGGAIAYNAYAGCPPVLGAVPVYDRSRCGDFNAYFLPPLTRPRQLPLILTADWLRYAMKPNFRFPGDGEARPSAASYRLNLLRSSCALAAGGPTWVVLPTPRFPYKVTPELQRRLIADPEAPDIVMPRSDYVAQSRDIVAALREAQRRCGVRLLDPAPYLCDSAVCPGSHDHHPLYFDEHHLTDYGTRRLVPMFRQVFAGD